MGLSEKCIFISNRISILISFQFIFIDDSCEIICFDLECGGF